MIEHADILKMSDEELDWILPTQDRLEQKAQALLRLGPSLMLVTRSCEGSCAFFRGGGMVTSEAVSTEVIDTLGAGDTFKAGILAKLSEFDLLIKSEISSLDHEVVQDTLNFANLAASVTVSRSEANPPWRREFAAAA